LRYDIGFVGVFGPNDIADMRVKRGKFDGNPIAVGYPGISEAMETEIGSQYLELLRTIHFQRDNCFGLAVLNSPEGYFSSPEYSIRIFGYGDDSGSLFVNGEGRKVLLGNITFLLEGNDYYLGGLYHLLLLSL
jgi:hypothetical protein